jgi:2-keto-4-pentenoate hydratase/2-oxohepta-3-ene-1,7-dioic acid hydratase in catechol pathway
MSPPSALPLRTPLGAIPCTPSKIIGIGRNYRAHAIELGHEIPTVPLYFLKAPSSLVGTGGTVFLPAESERVDYEGELGIVIGSRARRVAVTEALTYVAGYVVTCDVTARDLQEKDGQWSRAKGFDTFCPVSEHIVKVDNPDNLELTTSVNGVVRQSSNTGDMVFGTAELVAYVSQAMTLLPGDLILTGTPSGVGPLKPGDDVTVTISQIGSLTFTVAKE